MIIQWGRDFFDKSGRAVPIVMDTSKLINGHVFLVGASGVGKSHTIRGMIAQGALTSTDVLFHIFDVHGDLDVPGASVVQFSEQAGYGLNPFRVNPDRDFGGVRKCIQQFIRTINTASRTPLGLKQESVIRNLLTDIFEEFGFLVDDPSTWAMNEYESRLVSGGRDNRLYLNIPMKDKDLAKPFGVRWDEDKRLWWCHTEKYTGELLRWPVAYKERTYPTLKDVANYAKRLHEERFLGSDQKAVRALNMLNKQAIAYQRKLLNSIKQSRQDTRDEEANLELAEVRVKAVQAYTEYVNAIQTGHELDNLIKYDSPDVLKSVVDRLNNLLATGIFKATPPPFDTACSVWRYKLNPLSNEEKKLLVLFMLQDLFYKGVQRGQQSDVKEVFVLDELGTYVSSGDSDNGDGIIGTISREGRKFGLAIWAANQSPANIPESLISSVATKVILGLDEGHWTHAINKLKVDNKLLGFIVPQSTIAVQMKEKGSLKNRWWWVQLPNKKSVVSVAA
ncbi:MAG: DUF5710 domain-containing protein [Agitococcus sp.]|nr:DUF5710 domain-containing protein [Agitococcus sp.]